MKKVEKVKRLCLICGKEFEVYPQALIRRKCDFCSTSCYGKAKTIGLVKVKRQEIMLDCAYCGKQFTLPQWQTNYNRKYCSQSCARKDRRGKASPRSKNNFTRLMKEVKPNEKCAICGFDRYVEMAHVFPSMRGGGYDEENIIFLCPNHHRLFDSHGLTQDELDKLDNYVRLFYNFLPKRRGWKALM